MAYWGGSLPLQSDYRSMNPYVRDRAYQALARHRDRQKRARARRKKEGGLWDDEKLMFMDEQQRRELEQQRYLADKQFQLGMAGIEGSKEIARIQGQTHVDVARVQGGYAVDIAGIEADTSRYMSDRELEGVKYESDTQERIAGLQLEGLKYEADTSLKIANLKADIEREREAAKMERFNAILPSITKLMTSAAGAITAAGGTAPAGATS